MKRGVLIVSMLSVLLAGCSASQAKQLQALYGLDYSQQVVQKAAEEAVAQVGELIEARYGIEMPEEVKEQAVDLIVGGVSEAMNNLLEDAARREENGEETP